MNEQIKLNEQQKLPVSDDQLKIKNQTEQDAMAKAIEDYVAGRAKTLPNYIEYKDSPYYKINDKEITKIVYEEKPRPTTTTPPNQLASTKTLGIVTDSLPARNPVYVPDDHWSNTYLSYGYKEYSIYSATISGTIPGLTHLQDSSTGPFDELVFHLMGDRTDGKGAENCVQIIRSGNNAIFNFYDANYNDPLTGHVRDHATFPIGDTFSVYVKAWTSGSRDYNYVEYGVTDLNTGVSLDRIYQLPVTQICGDADIALEKYYQSGESRTATVNWNTVNNVHVSDVAGNYENMADTFHLFEYVTTGVSNANYTDYSLYAIPPYFSVTNGTANVYLTRYSGSTYPSHP
ncbi:hypothetical protein [Methanocella arvoryzae]|nr:hypothetical protein [Methanocella arvoryzae]